MLGSIHFEFLSQTFLNSSEPQFLLQKPFTKEILRTKAYSISERTQVGDLTIASQTYSVILSQFLCYNNPSVMMRMMMTWLSINCRVYYVLVTVSPLKHEDSEAWGSYIALPRHKPMSSSVGNLIHICLTPGPVLFSSMIGLIPCLIGHCRNMQPLHSASY